jgi:hypothetical protein
MGKRCNGSISTPASAYRVAALAPHDSRAAARVKLIRKTKYELSRVAPTAQATENAFNGCSDGLYGLLSYGPPRAACLNFQYRPTPKPKSARKCVVRGTEDFALMRAERTSESDSNLEGIRPPGVGIIEWLPMPEISVRNVLGQIEIYYSPSTVLLDRRGAVAERALSKGFGPRWRPQGDLVEIAGDNHFLQFGLRQSSCFWRLDERSDVTTFFLREVKQLANAFAISVAIFSIVESQAEFSAMVSGVQAAWKNPAFAFAKTKDIEDIGWLFNIRIHEGVALLRVGPMKRSQLVTYVSTPPLGESQHYLRRYSEDMQALPNLVWFAGLQDQEHVKLSEQDSEAHFLEVVKGRISRFAGINETVLANLTKLDMSSQK